MKAAVTTAYGPPETVALRDQPAPVPGKGDLLVRVHAAPVTAGDARIRGLDVPAGFGPFVRLAFGLRRPRRPVQGWALAGVVEAVGPGVTEFRPGDRVIGLTGLRGGAHAEQALLAASRTWLLPEGLSMAEGAAFFFGGLAAAHFLIGRGGLQPGERLLVNGATGAVGSAALQIAKGIGAVTSAVCSAGNADLARSLGATRVFDYRKEALDGGYDVILDVAGTLPYGRARHLLAPGGRLLLVTASLGQTLGAALRPRRGGQRVIAGTSGESRAAVDRLIGLYEAGSYRPRIGRSLPLDRIVEAHRIASGRHKPGNLVVTMV